MNGFDDPETTEDDGANEDENRDMFMSEICQESV